jgi:regulator of sigma E protease
MVDEREGPVAAVDLPHAFNRQPLRSRFAIVAAGPVFNFLLAFLLYWLVFMIGETGVRPLLGEIPEQTLAADAGFLPGEEIISVGEEATPTWSEAYGRLLEQSMDARDIPITVRTTDGDFVRRVLVIPPELAGEPEKLHDRLGFVPWQPDLDAVVDRIEPGSAAERSGLLPGDRLIEADGARILTWQQWVDYVRKHPDVAIRLIVSRGPGDVHLLITPSAITTPSGVIGRIGATVVVPPEKEDEMRVTYRLGFFPAMSAAWQRTYDYSALTLKMIGRMVIGKAALENLSGPLSIAQYAGASARMGMVQFMKFLAAVSVSLGVLNLLPIPVLDGGHLSLYAIEAMKGGPLSDKTVMICQQIGLFILISLMSLAFYLDIERLLS